MKNTFMPTATGLLCSGARALITLRCSYRNATGGAQFALAPPAPGTLGLDTSTALSKTPDAIFDGETDTLGVEI